MSQNERYAIEINSAHIMYESKADVVQVLREIADKIEEGYTGGQFVAGRPAWKLTVHK